MKEFFPACGVRPKSLRVNCHWRRRFIGIKKGEISQEKAAQLAGLDRADFISALAREGAEAFVVDFVDLKQELARG